MGPAWEPGKEIFSVTGKTGTQDVTYEGNLAFESDTLDISVESGPIVKIETKADEIGGTIIPFASGPVLTMNTASGTGRRNSVAMIGFGYGGTVTAPTDPIDLVDAITHVAFSMPAKGTITDMYAFLSATAGGLAGQNTVVTAQLFQSTGRDNNFSPIPDALIEFEEILGSPAAGTIRQGSLTNLSIDLEVGTRLLMVFFAETPAWTAGGTTLSGYLSGSVKIK